MPEQYRVEPAAGVKVGNLREEASMLARVVTTLERGQIVSRDPEREPDGDWLPVQFRGWMHKSILEEIG
jgi:hypothetical protein